MEREELLRNLKQVREKEKNKKYLTGQLNVFDMVSDVINYLEHEEKPKMTNFEYYKDEIKQIMKRKNEETMILNEVVGNAFNDFSLKYVNNYPYNHFKFIDWLLEEHKEPIKLKQWEYDAIKYHGQLPKFHDINFLMAMKNKGCFKDMNSIEKCSMTIKDILENCEIVSDDYEGFEDCK